MHGSGTIRRLNLHLLTLHSTPFFRPIPSTNIEYLPIGEYQIWPKFCKVLSLIISPYHILSIVSLNYSSRCAFVSKCSAGKATLPALKSACTEPTTKRPNLMSLPQVWHHHLTHDSHICMRQPNASLFVNWLTVMTSATWWRQGGYRRGVWRGPKGCGGGQI